MDPFLKKRRPLALTAVVTFMAVSGALVGASLKSRQQINGQEDPNYKEETGKLNVEDQIAVLESMKGQLMTQRKLVENKIAEVREKAKKREELEKERVEKSGQLGVPR